MAAGPLLDPHFLPRMASGPLLDLHFQPHMAAGPLQDPHFLPRMAAGPHFENATTKEWPEALICAALRQLVFSGPSAFPKRVDLRQRSRRCLGATARATRYFL